MTLNRILANKYTRQVQADYEANSNEEISFQDACFELQDGWSETILSDFTDVLRGEGPSSLYCEDAFNAIQAFILQHKLQDIYASDDDEQIDENYEQLRDLLIATVWAAVDNFIAIEAVLPECAMNADSPLFRKQTAVYEHLYYAASIGCSLQSASGKLNGLAIEHSVLVDGRVVATYVEEYFELVNIKFERAAGLAGVSYGA